MKWIRKDLEYLTDNYENNSNIYLSNKLNRGLNSVVLKASRLGLNKSKEYISKITILRNKSNGRDLSIENLKKIALSYKTKALFRLNDYSAYITAIKKDCLKDICEHMIIISYSTPQLICKHIFDILIDEECEYNTRKVIKPYELDLYYPNYKLAIEYNGKHWHSENDNTKLKYKLCSDLGISLFVIHEDSRNYSFDIKRDIIKILPKLSKILGKIITDNEVRRIKIDNSIYDNIIDKESVNKIINKYSKYSEFKINEPKLFYKLSRLKLLDKFIYNLYKNK